MGQSPFRLFDQVWIRILTCFVPYYLGQLLHLVLCPVKCPRGPDDHQWKDDRSTQYDFFYVGLLLAYFIMSLAISPKILTEPTRLRLWLPSTW